MCSKMYPVFLIHDELFLPRIQQELEETWEKIPLMKS